MTLGFKHILVIIAFLSSLGLRSQGYSEQEVKAAFVCNFAKFTEWPNEKFDSEDSPIVLAILGENPFGEAIYRIAQNVVIGKRKLMVQTFARLTDIQQAHLVYIGKPDIFELNDASYIFFMSNQILTISENPGFCEAGGVINFSKSKMKYGFEINPETAQDSKLNISAKLLKLATIVK